MNAPADPRFAQRCRESFGRQKAMALIGATLTVVEAGYVEIELPYREDLTQQKGFVHGGILGMIADTACGYSAFSLMPAGCSLVTRAGQAARLSRRAALSASGRTSFTRAEESR